MARSDTVGPGPFNTKVRPQYTRSVNQPHSKGAVPKSRIFLDAGYRLNLGSRAKGPAAAGPETCWQHSDFGWHQNNRTDVRQNAGRDHPDYSNAGHPAVPATAPFARRIWPQFHSERNLVSHCPKHPTDSGMPRVYGALHPREDGYDSGCFRASSTASLASRYACCTVHGLGLCDGCSSNRTTARINATSRSPRKSSITFSPCTLSKSRPFYHRRNSSKWA
jgi:predicted metal-binding protein